MDKLNCHVPARFSGTRTQPMMGNNINLLGYLYFYTIINQIKGGFHVV